MKKRVFSTELAYVLAILGLAVACALAERASLGLGIIVAPAYLVHLKLCPLFPAFTFGVAEYTLQAVLLVLLALVVRRFKISYLFSFVTAFIYGNVLDVVMRWVAKVPADSLLSRVCLYLVNMLLACAAVALFFKAYISPEAYELFVKEVAERYGLDLGRVKVIYDVATCLVSIAMSFLFFGWGELRGLGVASFLSVPFNGPLIGWYGRLFDRFFTFQDTLPLRRFFER